jgi:alanyl-tRNA synthetase
MTSQQVRKSFVDFFVGKGHLEVPSASLVPDALSTTLFTIAGMEQFVPVFLGEEAPPAPRVVTVQRCLRVAGGKNDIESVGRSGRHGTFLEMLGNFSFGDYYKRDAIGWAWEYLTRELGLDPKRLHATVYETDDEAAALWRKEVGLPRSHISRFREDNFWDMGPTGPCGPSSEIFYDLGPAAGCGRADCAVGCPHCNRYLEFWNLVFQQFDRTSDGSLKPLPKHAIDTGMGFERLCMILEGKTSIFDTDLYTPIIEALPPPARPSQLRGEEAAIHRRIIADHARATVFLAADGVTPSNNDRGYVMRFLMRRALRSGRRLGLPQHFLSDLVGAVVQSLAEGYPQLREAKAPTKKLFSQEERLFNRTLERGEARLDAMIAAVRASRKTKLSGDQVFELYDTYGFPPELTVEIANENNLVADMTGYHRKMEEQRERARRDAKAKRAEVKVSQSGTVDLPDSEFVGYERLEAKAKVVALFDQSGAAVDTLAAGQQGVVLLDQTPFYAERGGQAGDHGILAKPNAAFEVLDATPQDKTSSRVVHKGRMLSGELHVGDTVDAQVDPHWRIEIRRHHTVTHLLQRALKEVLGDSVAQRGSAVFPNHTRFDFDAPGGAMRKEQEQQVESRVNELIRADFHRDVAIMPFAKAVARGAIYMKDEHYGDEVRVVTFGPSVELCGGTHVESTGEIGHFVLTSESAIAAGIRRVEGVVSEAADAWVHRLRQAVERAGATLTVPPEKLAESVMRLAHERRELEKRIDSLQAALADAGAAEYLGEVKSLSGVSYLAVRADTAGAVRSLSDALRSRLPHAVIAVMGGDDSKVSALVTVSDDVQKKGVSARELLNAMMPFVGGKGGGSAAVAQGGGKDVSGIDAALAALPSALRAALDA